jgi:thioredoxin-related protein
MRAAQLSIVILLSWTVLARADGVQWVRDLDTAKRIAAQTNRPILLHFWSPSCAPCMALEREVYSRPDVKAALEAMFVPVHVNADESQAITSHYGVTRLPTDVVLAPNGQVITQLKCPLVATQYLAQLVPVARGNAAGPVTPRANGNYSAAERIAANAGNATARDRQIVQASATAPASTESADTAATGRGAWSGTATDRIANQSWRQPNPVQSPPQSAYGPISPPEVQSVERTDQIAQQALQQPSAPIHGYGASGQSSLQQPVYGQSPSSSTSTIGIAAPAASSTMVISPANGGVGQQDVDSRSMGVPAEQIAAANQTQGAQAAGVASMMMVPATQAPPLGLDGNCPVMLHKLRNEVFTDATGRKANGKWTKGDPRYGVVHRGRTYLFSGPAEQQEFLSNPDRYSPVLCGNDPVLAIEVGQQVPGRRGLGVFYGDRVYLFATHQSLAKFDAEAKAAQREGRANKYAEAIYHAENAGQSLLR